MTIESVLVRCAYNQTSKTTSDLSVRTLTDRTGRVFFRVGEMRSKDGTKIIPVAIPGQTKIGTSTIPTLTLQLVPCIRGTWENVASEDHFKNLIDRSMIVVLKDGKIQQYPGEFGKPGTLGGFTLKVSEKERYVLNAPGGCSILTSPGPTETPEYLKATFAHLFRVEAEERKIEASTVHVHVPRPPSTPRPPVTTPPSSARGATTVPSSS